VLDASTHFAAAAWLALAAVASCPAVAGADTSRLDSGLEWDYCGPRPARLGSAKLPPPPSDDEPVSIAADNLSYDQATDELKLRGDIDLIQGSRRLSAQEATYDVDAEEILAEDDVYIEQPGVRLQGPGAQLNLKTNEGRVEEPEYRFTGPLNARGTAQVAELLGDGNSRYEEIVYSTCRPGQNDWDIKADKLDINQEEGRGVARHAKVRVAGVPVLYTPYISFPIDDRRKSGFLIPTIGSSDDSGFELITPYYFNIAPSMDATLFPRYMSRRGLMLGAEYRVLTKHHSAEIYAEGIAKDGIYEEDGARGAVKIEYEGNYGSGWSSDVIFREVSDNEYLEDFGNQLELTSVRNIERRGDLNYSGTGWRSRLRLQDFQTVDSSISLRARPYSRLPQLSVITNDFRLDSGLEFGLTAQYDYFEHNRKVHGHRATMVPYVAWPKRKSYGYLTPRLNFYGAAYSLEEESEGNPSDPSYAIPSFNLDGKLIFERDVQWLGQDGLQTLEPRVFYLYTAFEEQDDLPVFDSSELTFSYASLFRANRFSGLDRIGDANQLTLGLTSRTLEMATGRELFRASVGQILYFQNREVQIRGLPEDQDSSALVGEVSARLLDSLTGRLSFQWDPNKDEEQSEKRVLELRYQSREDRLVNLAYRFDLGTTEATRYEDMDLSMRWPFNPQLEFFGRWYYSLLNSQTTEAFAGVEYGRCCWKLRLLGQHIKNKPDSSGENRVMIQLVLAGLGSFGHKIDTLLERGIYGYDAE
jgi:LPS-assembly protein